LLLEVLKGANKAFQKWVDRKLGNVRNDASQRSNRLGQKYPNYRNPIDDRINRSVDGAINGSNNGGWNNGGWNNGGRNGGRNNGGWNNGGNGTVYDNGSNSSNGGSNTTVVQQQSQTVIIENGRVTR